MAVLHLDPDKVVTGIGHGTVDIRVRRRNRATDYLPAFGQLGLDGIEDANLIAALLSVGAGQHRSQQ